MSGRVSAPSRRPRGAGLASTAEIDLRLDPDTIAGWMDGRHDIVVTGSVAAEDPVESVSLLLDGHVRALVLYSQTSASARRHTFSLNLARPADQSNATTSIEIAARTRNGQERRMSFTLSTNERGATAVVDGPTSEVPVWAGATPPILLYVEVAQLGGGVLRVSGWAATRNPLLVIQAFADDERIGSAHIGQARDDIAVIHAAYPNAASSGFSLLCPWGSEQAPATIAVEAIDIVGTVSRTIVPVSRAEDVPAPASLAGRRAGQNPVDLQRRIFLHCDTAALYAGGELHVSGWAVCATGIAGIAVSLDAATAGEAETGLPRPDVAAEYPGIPQARFSGFEFRRRLPDAGETARPVTILVRNGLNDTRELVVPAVVTQEPPAPTPEEQTANPDVFRLEIDNPVIINDEVPGTVVGRLVIEGWALARSGATGIEIFLDGESLGQAYYGVARRDVEAAFPNWENALRSGYAFHLPSRFLRNGSHVVRVQLNARDGGAFSREFHIDIQLDQDGESYRTIRRVLPQSEVTLYRDIIGRLGEAPLFHLVLPIKRNPLEKKIEATLRALAGQAYLGWHLSVLGDAAAAARVLDIAGRVGLVERVAAMRPQAGPDGFQRPAAGGQTCLVGVLFPGDELGGDALAELAVAHGLHPEAGILYADEDRVSPASGLREPFFKPDWSPDLLLSTNYIGRPWVASTALLREAGVTPRSLLSAQGDYDAILRCTERAAQIHHVPKLLCRRDEDSGADPKAEQCVLRAAAARRGEAAVLYPGCIPGTWRLRRTTPARGKVSIIIPTCAANGYIATCLNTLRTRTSYRDIEIICIDNIPADMPEWKSVVRAGADKVVDIPDSFNWSRFNNRAAAVAEGEFLLFLNDDIEVQQMDWLEALLEHAQRPEVGVVGPQLLYPDRKVQHAGIFLVTLGVGRHSFRFQAEDDPGYFGLALTTRNVIAVTGACMLMRREVFESVRGFDEGLAVAFNDIDLCLRIRQAGFRNLWTPFAELYHHESASRGYEDTPEKIKRFQTEIDLMRQRWSALLPADPAHNVNLPLVSDGSSYAFPPRDASSPIGS